MQPNPVLYPMVALVAWTFVILLVMRHRRFSAARQRLVRPADFAVGESPNVPLPARLAARNFANLCEMPILFYAACLTAQSIALGGWLLPALGWLYVALRVGHSWVHITHNNVMQRVKWYGASAVVLMAIWVRILVALVQGA